MNKAALGRTLVRAATAQGLPSGREATALSVAQWLYEHGIYDESIECEVSTLKEVAEFFGVRYDTVRQGWAKGTKAMPGASDGPYRIHDIYKWKVLRFGDSGTTAAQKADLELQRRKREAEADLKEEEARAKKLKNDLTSGLFYESDETDRKVAEFASRVKMRLEAFPDEMEMRFPAKQRNELKTDSQERIYLVLKEMSEWELLGGKTAEEIILHVADMIRGAKSA